jgi:hypothetical protein
MRKKTLLLVSVMDIMSENGENGSCGVMMRQSPPITRGSQSIHVRVKMPVLLVGTWWQLVPVHS